MLRRCELEELYYRHEFTFGNVKMDGKYCYRMLKDQGQDIVKTIEQLADNPTVQLERLDEKRIMAYRGSRPFKNYRGRGRRRRDEDDVWFPNYEECPSSPERGRRDDEVEIYEELLKTSPKTTIKRRNSCFVSRSGNDKNCDNLTKADRKLVVHRSKSIDSSDIMCYTDFRVTRSKSHLYSTVGILQEMYQTLGVTVRSRTKGAIKDDQKENVPKVQVNKKAKAKESSDVANKATPKQINCKRRKTIACLPTGNLPQDMPILDEVAVKSVKIGGKTVEKAKEVKSHRQSERVAAKTNKQVNTPIASEKIIPCCSSEGKARPEKKEYHAKARVCKRKSAVNGSQSNPKKQKKSKEGKDAVGKLSLPITIPLSQPLNLSFSQPISVKSNSSKMITDDRSCDLSTVSVNNSSDCVNLDHLMNEIFKEDDEASTTSSISLTYISETNSDECTTVTMEPEKPSKIVHQLSNGATTTYMSSSVANIATDFRVTRSKSHLYSTVGILQEMYQTLGVTVRSRTKGAIKDDQKENVPKVQVNKKAKAKESSDVANKATPKQINCKRRKTIACLPTGNLPQDMPILDEVAVKSVKIGGKTVEKAKEVKSHRQSERVAAKTNKQVNTPIASEKIIPCCSSEGKARPEKKLLDGKRSGSNLN